MKHKVFIANTSKPYEDMFLEYNFEIVTDYKEADLVQFTGGPDISPYYYQETPHSKTKTDSVRDKYEESLYKTCYLNQVPMVGICRGAQFLTVMNKGKLWQNVDGHDTGQHNLIDKKTKKIICKVSSTHHQMMRPFNSLVIATANESTFLEDYSNKYGCTLIDHEDIEVVYFKRSNSLCFQPHPEFEEYKECREYYFSLIFKYLFKNKKEKYIKTYKGLGGLEQYTFTHVNF